MDLPTVIGKPMGECTIDEVRLMAVAYMRLAEIMEKKSR
jgi:hypothetical protein